MRMLVRCVRTTDSLLMHVLLGMIRKDIVVWYCDEHQDELQTEADLEKMQLTVQQVCAATRLRFDG